MAKSKTPAIDGVRLADIMSKITGQAGRLTSGDLDLDEAKNAVTNLRDAGVSLREVVLLDFATLSAADKWLPHEITEACKQVIKASNSKTQATFISEAKNVAHPRVRDQFTHLMAIRDELWPAEPDEVNVIDPACAKVWSRRYHMLTKMSQLVAKAEVTGFADTNAVISYAVENDPDHDAAKIQKRLDKISKDLAEFYVDFPHPELEAASELVGDIDVKKLRRARDQMLAEREEDAEPVASMPVPVVRPHIVPVAAPIAVASAPTGMAEGASSIINDILGEAEAA